MENAIELRHVTKTFGRVTANRDVSLELKKGEILSLLGENGSGKTTWMKMVAGLTKPSHGEIIYKGHPLCYRDKGEIAYMATEPFFYDFMKVGDVGDYYADFFPDFDRRRFDELIGKMNLIPGQKVKNLSSGMNAKLKLAAVLSRRASLCLLDEPLNGIDYKAREEIVRMILEEADEKKTFVISTHLLEEIESFIDYAVFIRDGQLVDKIDIESERMRSGRALAEIYMDLM